MPNAPLADRVRPTSLDEVVGQDHLVGKNRPLRMAVESNKPHSMILWGPPGVGKTTLARILAHSFNAEFTIISAVLAGVKDIREVIERAQTALSQKAKQTILFVDEVHRFNKNQQDAFLPHVESGLLIFIGATTENPSFEVNNALLSRVQVYALESLKPDVLKVLFQRISCDALFKGMHVDEDALDTLACYADGDARRFLNGIEQLVYTAQTRGIYHIDEGLSREVMGDGVRLFDKRADHFYDQISALHKSVRGSHTDASLYWFCRLLDGGMDPRYIARRIVRMAWEDIGLADPRAADIALNAAHTYERLGSPEGELALAEAVIYLSVAPKSNAGYLAYQQAKDFVKSDNSRAVPKHLRNAPTKLMKDLGYGQHYRYAHDEPHAYVTNENYFPKGMPKVQWYCPTSRGLESKITAKMKFLHELDQKIRDKKCLFLICSGSRCCSDVINRRVFKNALQCFSDN